MIERDFVNLRFELRHVLGFVANAEITYTGAVQAARVVVELDDKIREHATHPADLFRAVIATSQLVRRWGQLRQDYMAGSIRTVIDADIYIEAQEELARGNLPEEEAMRLTAIAYVANPCMGANSAMDVLSKLQAMYSDIHLQQPQE
jgi:hypothetical protein